MPVPQIHTQFQSKECFGKVYILCHETQHLQSCLLTEAYHTDI